MNGSPKLFVAGATGVIGRAVLSLCKETGISVVGHIRPRSAAKQRAVENAAVVELSNTEALSEAMRGCTALLQLIGTMKKRFGTGDTYQSSDIDTTEQLLRAARGGTIRHVVLLSSAGAGRPIGAYLQAKAQAEELVRQSGLPFTIVRPSAFTGSDERRVPHVFTAAMRLFGLEKYQPIEVADVARLLVHLAVSGGPTQVTLEGRPLWQEVHKARAALGPRPHARPPL
jgi:uncharacterized protein YbjT (DUF2867 family)